MRDEMNDNNNCSLNEMTHKCKMDSHASLITRLIDDINLLIDASFRL